jgi:hypothetical protein
VTHAETVFVGGGLTVAWTPPFEGRGKFQALGTTFTVWWNGVQVGNMSSGTALVPPTYPLDGMTPTGAGEWRFQSLGGGANVHILWSDGSE